MSLPWNLAADAFSGAAEAYARYRPPYPSALLRDLLERAAVGAGGTLLDLASGPGRVALDLAPAFATVLAVDLEPEMVQVGRAEAARRGVQNITWQVGRAEDFGAAPDSIDLITIGEAFHRLDEATVAAHALGWLRPGRCLATLGTDGVLAGDDPWHATLRGVRDRWMARAFPDGWGLTVRGASTGQEPRELVLREAGFIDVESRSFDVLREWTLEEIVGYLQSTSVCSRKALGDGFDAFIAELRTALLDLEPSLRFHETITWGYTLARKPG
jgi:SAM-dependent methyltransferase